MSEGKLAGQVYALKRHGEFSDLEIEGFRRELDLIPVPLEASQTTERPAVKSCSSTTAVSW